MLEPIKQNPRKIKLGFPKCVCGKPFTLVHSPAEERAWIADNGPIKIEKAEVKAPEVKLADPAATDTKTTEAKAPKARASL